jgi:HEAT repeat protein
MDCFRRILMAFTYPLVIVMFLSVPCSCFAATPLDEVKAAFKNTEWEVRLAAIEKLKGLTDEETVDFLMAVAGDQREYWSVQTRAIQFMGEIRNPKTLDLLLKIFTSRSREYECPAIKSYTAIALGNFRGYSDVIDPLIAGIGNDEPLTREASVRSLGTLGNVKAVPHLIPLLQSPSLAMRLGAIKALETLGDPQAIPHLENVAEKDSDRVTREIAMMAVHNLRSSQEAFKGR